MPSLATLAPSIHLDRERIERELEAILVVGPRGSVPDAMRYAVLGQGQRIRPLLALRLARLAGAETEHTLRAAVAVELIHCASLIVDDLPCMDNESFRRDRPTVHVAYGEATALLGAFALVALAARTVVEQRCVPSEMSNLIQFQIELLKVLDVGSLIEGQHLDLKLQGEQRELSRNRVNELKTVPLFELAAKAALISYDSNGPESLACRRFAREFGIAFQMVDDYLDGEVSSLEDVEAQLTRTRRLLGPLRPAGAELDQLIDYLNARCIKA